ncbi:hypothetical protein GCM10010121_090840 [Streptomyces brasiliensis]|uniref:Uncharacterized protein n=1 Tax=Streptomyces brasiliensis TaxID=1954 RepID=A0A917P808_9ACTN|nr:hypothetical protein GCM10010121_090840 [Streptomyces brasiliensis]
MDADGDNYLAWAHPFPDPKNEAERAANRQAADDYQRQEEEAATFLRLAEGLPPVAPELLLGQVRLDLATAGLHVAPPEPLTGEDQGGVVVYIDDDAQVVVDWLPHARLDRAALDMVEADRTDDEAVVRYEVVRSAMDTATPCPLALELPGGRAFRIVATAVSTGSHPGGSTYPPISTLRAPDPGKPWQVPGARPERPARLVPLSRSPKTGGRPWKRTARWRATTTCRRCAGGCGSPAPSRAPTCPPWTRSRRSSGCPRPWSAAALEQLAADGLVTLHDGYRLCSVGTTSRSSWARYSAVDRFTSSTAVYVTLIGT